LRNVIRIVAAAACLIGLTGAAQEASPMEPTIQAAECLAALKYEGDQTQMAEDAKRFFDRRLSDIRNEELRELLTISAEEAVLRNSNRREIASTCVLLYQVLKLQEERAANPAPRASPE